MLLKACPLDFSTAFATPMTHSYSLPSSTLYFVAFPSHFTICWLFFLCTSRDVGASILSKVLSLEILPVHAGLSHHLYADDCQSLCPSPSCSSVPHIQLPSGHSTLNVFLPFPIQPLSRKWNSSAVSNPRPTPAFLISADGTVTYLVAQTRRRTWSLSLPLPHFSHPIGH